MIRDSYENNFSYAETQHNFDLIRMLVEIGLEKLNRDYIVILLGIIYFNQMDCLSLQQIF